MYIFFLIKKKKKKKIIIIIIIIIIITTPPYGRSCFVSRTRPRRSGESWWWSASRAECYTLLHKPKQTTLNRPSSTLSKPSYFLLCVLFRPTLGPWVAVILGDFRKFGQNVVRLKAI